MAYCHLRGVKVYLTLNTLLQNRELALAAETGALAARLGIDAILVQDLGVAKLLRETCPDVPLHASTQMTVHDLAGIQACAAPWGRRWVGAVPVRCRGRPSNISCEKSPVELEVFGHGALCMCYTDSAFSRRCWGDGAATGDSAPSPAGWLFAGRGIRKRPIRCR